MELLLQWDALIAAYLGYLTAISRPETTRLLRLAQLKYFAKTVARPPATVRHDDVIHFFAMHRWAPETRRSYRSGLRGFFSWAHDHGHLGDNPMLRIPQISIPKAAPRPCPDDVYEAALARADTRVSLMLRMAAEAGLRRAEIAAVHRNDVRKTPHGYELLVHGKGANQRVVPLHDGLAQELLGAQAWVFPSQRGGHLSPRAVGKMTSECLGSATLHQLRHRFATKAYRGSRNLRAVQQLLGHSNLAITERYIDVDAAERRAAMMAAVA